MGSKRPAYNVIDYWGRYNDSESSKPPYRKLETTPANPASLRVEKESSIDMGLEGRNDSASYLRVPASESPKLSAKDEFDLDLLENYTPSNPENELQLQKYLKYLQEYSPEIDADLPGVPPCKIPPERGVAWRAWWDAVENSRRNRSK